MVCFNYTHKTNGYDQKKKKKGKKEKKTHQKAKGQHCWGAALSSVLISPQDPEDPGATPPQPQSSWGELCSCRRAPPQCWGTAERWGQRGNRSGTEG